MSRRQPTEAQKEAAAARRERFRALVKTVAEMPEAQRVELVNKAGAVVTCEGRALSVKNTCLLFMQLPTVSMVGGFNQWRHTGRMVRKGEKGLSIWVPTSRPAADGETDGELFFIMGTVFDVSQTDAVETAEAVAA